MPHFVFPFGRSLLCPARANVDEGSNLMPSTLARSAMVVNAVAVADAN
jgi:hypothetical protein